MSVSNKAISALQSIPFGNMIGGPMNACIEAQAEAAQTTVNFIKNVGLNTKTAENGDETHDVVYVYFQFIQNGRKAIISVPLLTIVPIPYIAISTVDIVFKATVTGVDATSEVDTSSSAYDRDTSSNKKSGWFGRKTTKVNTSFSSKKDSSSTKDSSYSIEATIDVSVHATQDSMPAGMAKVLEMLGSAMDLCDPNGELIVSDTVLYTEGAKTVELIAQYKTPGGLYDPSAIKIDPSATTDTTDVAATYALGLKDDGKEQTYTITAGSKKVVVKIKKAVPATT